MSLDAAARRRFARHLLLAEIGEDGQERLVASRFRTAATSDGAAYATAALYLERAGCVPDPSSLALRVPDPDAVERFAGHPALREAAGLIAGAFSAVEHIKATLGIAPPGELSSELRLSG